jgi:hypothetical protein
MFVRTCGLATQAVRVSLILLVFSAILHATSIKENGIWHLLRPETTNPGIALAGAHGALELAAVDHDRGVHAKSEVSLNLATNTCLLASSCSNPVEIPEPQSWLLFGTGLLSVASMIRRRLWRRVR